VGANEIVTVVAPTVAAGANASETSNWDIGIVATIEAPVDSKSSLVSRVAPPGASTVDSSLASVDASRPKTSPPAAIAPTQDAKVPNASPVGYP